MNKNYFVAGCIFGLFAVETSDGLTVTRHKENATKFETVVRLRQVIFEKDLFGLKWYVFQIDPSGHNGPKLVDETHVGGGNI